MHATTLDLELFVTARLDDERSAWLEHHCEACDACAAAIANEARLEVALRSLAADLRCGMRADAPAAIEPLSLTRPPVPPKPRLYAFAAAAAMGLAFFTAHLPQPEVPQPAVAFADAGDFAKAQSPSPAWAGSELSGGTP
jgi:anti-sigma factor RsiW